jgi:superfamily II DNA/RNA helicase
MFKKSTKPAFSRGGRDSSSFKKRSFGQSAPRRNNKRQTKRIDENLFIQKTVVSAPKDVYVPKHTFSEFLINDQLKKNIAKKEYITPSPIQDQTIALALQGHDIIGVAGTGTGKTAAFLIPLINKLLEQKSSKQKVLILAPTRELANQIEVEFRSLAYGMKLFSVSCVGGSPIGKQMRELERGVHIVIGTPGRVTDLINRGKIVTEDFHSIVLDEADRMLDMEYPD